MEQAQIPEGGVVRDDGCICPPPPEEKDKCEGAAAEYEPCPYDPRFPNTNQTKHCYFSFVDYQRCARLLGDYPGCLIFYRCYKELCPSAWVEKWFEQMEKGTFPRKIYPPKPIVHPDPAQLKAICLDPEEESDEIIC